MAVRTDVSVLPDYSPRIVLVASPSAEINAQDLYDTLRAWEDSPEGQTYDTPIIDAGGKEDLGGIYVGITATLLNAYIMFAARSTPNETGTVTTPDAAGLILTDSAGDFSGLAPGDLVQNTTDGSKGTVIEILSNSGPARLKVAWLEGGGDNQFDLNDTYEAFHIVQCEVTGGNVVAVDSLGSVMDAIVPSFGVQVVRTYSTSAALLEGTGADTAAIADAVWDELEAGHALAGSFGKAVSDVPTAAEVDSELTSSHGAGGWTTASPPSAAAIAVEVDSELTSQHGAGDWTAAAVTTPSAADIADAVLDEAVAGHTTPGSAGEALVRVELLKKILTNRLVLSDGTTGNHILYDDDNTTPLLTWDVSDKDGQTISIPSGSPARRSKGA